jgi:hypothetical protein
VQLFAAMFDADDAAVSLWLGRIVALHHLLIYFISEPRTYSVRPFLKRQCDRTQVSRLRAAGADPNASVAVPPRDSDPPGTLRGPQEILTIVTLREISRAQITFLGARRWPAGRRRVRPATARRSARAAAAGMVQTVCRGAL